jgi:ABC-type nickel/cobalt efflux system permease component RcnA
MGITLVIEKVTGTIIFIATYLIIQNWKQRQKEQTISTSYNREQNKYLSRHICCHTCGHDHVIVALSSSYRPVQSVPISTIFVS